MPEPMDPSFVQMTNELTKLAETTSESPYTTAAAGEKCTDCYWLTPFTHMSCCAHLHRSSSSSSASSTKHRFQVESNIAGSFSKLGEEPCNYSLVSAHFDESDIESEKRIRCGGCSTACLEDGDQVIIPVAVGDVHEAYEGLANDDLNNSRQELLHDDTGWYEKFTSVLSLVEQGENDPTSTNRSIGTNSSDNQTLNYHDKELKAAYCSKRKVALYHCKRAASSSSAHIDNSRDPRTRAISTVPFKKVKSPVLARNAHLTLPGETGIYSCFNDSVRTVHEENNGLVDYDQWAERGHAHVLGCTSFVDLLQINDKSFAKVGNSMDPYSCVYLHFQAPLPLIACGSTYVTVSNEHSFRVSTDLHNSIGSPKKSLKGPKLKRWKIPGGSMNIYSAGVHPCENIFYCNGGDEDDEHPCGDGITCSL